MSEITKYLPVRKLTVKQKAIKLIKYQLIIVSVLLNLLLAHQQYNIRCQINGKVAGWFTSKQTCEDLSQARIDQLELARLNFLQTNSDILK